MPPAGPGVPLPLAGPGVPLPLPGAGGLLPLAGPELVLADGGASVVVVGGGWVPPVLLPLLLPPGAPAMGVVCVPVPVVVAVAIGSAGVDAVATDVEPEVPAGWSARACATTTNARTIVARTRPSFVR